MVYELLLMTVLLTKEWLIILLFALDLWFRLGV